MFQAFFSPTLFSELYSSRPSFKSFLAFSFTCRARADSVWGGWTRRLPLSPGRPGQLRVPAPQTHGGGLLGAGGDPRESRAFQEGAGTLRGGDSTRPPTTPPFPGHAPHRTCCSLAHDIPPYMLALWEHTLGTAGHRAAVQSVGPPLASKLLTLSHLCLVCNTGT